VGNALLQAVCCSQPQAQSQLHTHAALLARAWPLVFVPLQNAIGQFDWPLAEMLLEQQGFKRPASCRLTTDKPVVLVVDDNPTNLTLMADLLAQTYTVLVAHSGARALHIASHQPVNLVLLDVMMPVMDGYEVCRQLRRWPSLDDCPILFLTAKTQLEDTELGLRLGAQDYISKPIVPPLVLARLHTHLALQAARRQCTTIGRINR
jgi:CheY-like chemotaxis protein